MSRAISKMMNKADTSFINTKPHTSNFNMKRLKILLFFAFLLFFKPLYCMKGLYRSTDPNYKRVQSIDNATDPIKSISFSPDGKIFASGSQTGKISIWKCGVDKLLYQGLFQAHNDSIYSLIYSPCGKFLASASRDGTVKIWNHNDDNEYDCRDVINIDEYESENLLGLAFSQDGKSLHIGFKNSIKVLKIIGPSGYSEFVNQSFFNTTKKITKWILGDDDIFRPIGYIIDSSSGSTASVIAFSTYDKNEAACVEDTTIKIWVLDKNQEWYCKQTLEGHKEPINCIAFSPDATKITPEIWDIKGQKILFLNDDENMWISEQDNNEDLLQLDAKNLASGSEDTTIKIWVLDENQEWYCKQTLDGHTGPVNCLAFSPGGTTIASGSTNGEIKIWRLCNDNQWYCIATLEADIGPVNSIAFFPYGGMSFACVCNTGMEIWFDKKLWFWWGAEKAIADGFTI